MKKGDSAILLFSMCGFTTEEEYTVIDVSDGAVTLNTSEDKDECFRFDRKTGKCLNDKDFAGASRALKI